MNRDKSSMLFDYQQILNHIDAWKKQIFQTSIPIKTTVDVTMSDLTWTILYLVFIKNCKPLFESFLFCLGLSPIYSKTGLSFLVVSILYNHCSI
jgi:hypothetical protein